MWTRIVSLLVFACIVQARPALAGVLVVDASGPGPFTDLPAAVSAASDGDVLLLKSGVYSAATISNKALDLVADAGAAVVVQGPIVVSNLAATRAVTLTGMTLRGSSASPALSLLSNSGSLRIQGCTIEGFDQPDCMPTSSPVPGGSAISIVDSTDVAIVRCTLHGGRGGDYTGYASGGDGGHALAASGSRVAMYESELRGARGGTLSAACGTFGYGYPGDGGDGSRVTNCPVVFASGCELSGGDGGSGGYGACPGVGVRRVSSSLTTLDCAITAGGGGFGCCTLCTCSFAVCPLSPWQVVVGPPRRLVATRVARENGVARIDVFGVPGDSVELRFAANGAFQSNPSGTGVDLLRRARPTPVAQLGTIGPSGQLTTSWNPADLGPGVLGARLFVQADFIEPAGRVLRGPPATIVLLDSSL